MYRHHQPDRGSKLIRAYNYIGRQSKAPYKRFYEAAGGALYGNPPKYLHENTSKARSNAGLKPFSLVSRGHETPSSADGRQGTDQKYQSSDN